MIKRNQKVTLDQGTIVYVTPLERDGDTRAIRGIVIESNDDYVVVDYVDDVCAASDTMVQIGFHFNQRFVTAPARVARLVQTVPNCRIQFSLADCFKNNDMRSAFRVCVAGYGMRGEINDEEVCDVLDVSANGLAIVSQSEFKRGLILHVSFEFDARRFTGKAIIRNVGEAKHGRHRFGLEVLKGETNLLQGLQHASVKIQREQLKRLRDKGTRAA